MNRLLGGLAGSLLWVSLGCGAAKGPPAEVSGPRAAEPATSVAKTSEAKPPAKPGATREACVLACMEERCNYQSACESTCAEVAASTRRTEGDFEAAFAQAVRGFERGDPRFCAKRRNDGTVIGDGVLAREYRKLHPRAEGRGSYCSSPDEKTDITEIALERTSCFGTCPAYTVRLRADGSVDYDGGAYVERAGKRHGRLPESGFQGLAALALDIVFFDLDESYSCMVTDMPTVFISVTRAGKKKIVRHYGGTMTGPPRLSMFEDTIDTYTDSVEWSDAPRH